MIARLAALAAVLTLATAARAEGPTTYRPPPYTGGSSPSGGGNPYAAPAPNPPEPPVNFVLTFGFDFGQEKLISATMSDGSSQDLKANEGLNAAVGASFLKLDGGRFATQATIGIEYSAISASNGSVRWLAYPFEVMEMAYLDPIRIGAGVSVLLSPSVKGDGFFDGIDVPFKKSLGFVVEGDYVFRLRSNPRAAKFTIGVRYVAQSLKPDIAGATGSIDANAFGIVLGYTG